MIEDDKFQVLTAMSLDRATRVLESHQTMQEIHQEALQKFGEVVKQFNEELDLIKARITNLDLAIEAMRG